MQVRKQVFVIMVSAALLMVVVLSLAAQEIERGPSPVMVPVTPIAQIPAPAVSGVTSISASEQDQAAALAFWTKERLAEATPLDMPVDFGPAVVDASASADFAADGPPGYVAGGLPAISADAEARADYPEEWAAVDEAADISELLSSIGMATNDSIAAVDGTSQTYTSYIVNKNAAVQTFFGHRVSGRLSFSTPSGTSYCSASVISPNNVIVTAAHCIYDTASRNAFYSNFVFTPAYRNGNAPYGTFAHQTCWVLNSWIALSGSYSINSWADDDVAVCKMRNNSAGKSLSALTGWFGRGWNWGYTQHFHTLGYPFRNTSDALLTDAGKYLRTCASESFQQASNVVGTGCNWSRGNSGGPFVVGYSLADVTGQVRSVYSGFYIGTQNAYGARFNSNNIVPLCNAAGC